MVSSRQGPGSEQTVGVMLDVGCLGSLLDHTFLNVLCLLFSLSFAYVSHHICQSLLQPHHFTPSFPISLNSLDLAGVEIAESLWLTDTSKTSLQVPLNRVGEATKLRRSSMKILSFVLSRSSWSVVEPSWGRSGTFVAFGVLLLFWFRSRTMSVFDWCNALFM